MFEFEFVLDEKGQLCNEKHIGHHSGTIGFRRGKNLYKSVWKDDTVRTMMVAQVDNFKEKWPAARNKIQANLFPPGPCCLFFLVSQVRSISFPWPLVSKQGV